MFSCILMHSIGFLMQYRPAFVPLFGGQLYYFYAEPLPLTPKSTLRITCDYDTQSAKTPVLPGWGTQNEMCLAGLFVVPNM